MCAMNVPLKSQCLHQPLVFAEWARFSWVPEEDMLVACSLIEESYNYCESLAQGPADGYCLVGASAEESASFR